MLFMACSQLVYSQDYRQEADKCLAEGDYKCAIRNLQLYQEEDGTEDVSQQIRDAETCMAARILADNYFEENEYGKAMQQYEKIPKLNPKDVHAKRQYDLCVAQQSPKPAEDEIVAQEIEPTPPEVPETLIEDSILTVKGANIFAGKKLKRGEVRSLMANTQALKLYNDGKSKRKTGMWLIGTGVLLPVIGAWIGAGAVGSDNWEDSYVIEGNTLSHEWHNQVLRDGIIGGAVGAVVGAACIVTGLRLRVSGKKNIHKAADTYNNLKKTDPGSGELHVGITPNGVGLVYSF
jgi:tetratricopeptide (TPR) repeat protein